MQIHIFSGNGKIEYAFWNNIKMHLVIICG